jgi:hypothetical protein
MHLRSEKSPKRVIRMTLPVALIEVIEEMGQQCTIGGPLQITAPRTLHNMIKCALTWAAWSYTLGRNPDQEMLQQPGGYTCLDEKIRSSREIADLEKLYGLADPDDPPPAAEI